MKYFAIGITMAVSAICQGTEIRAEPLVDLPAECQGVYVVSMAMSVVESCADGKLSWHGAALVGDLVQQAPFNPTYSP